MFLFAGCVQSGGGFGSTDVEFMAHMKEVLTEEQIAFTEDETGFIRFDPNLQANVDAIIQRVRIFRSRFVILDVDNDDELDYLIQLIEQKGYEYRIIESGGKTKVESPLINEEEGIILDFVEYRFRKKIGNKDCSKTVSHNKSLNTDARCAGAG